MKRKFLILTLCFTIFFSSINLNKSYADGGLISLPMLATISSLAIGSGIVLSSDDDLYDLGRMFYDYVKSKNEMTWDVLAATFNSSVSILNNGLVSVDSKFLDIVKDFFDNSFTPGGSVCFSYSIPYYSERFDWPNKNYYSGPSVSVSRLGDGTVGFSVGSLDFVPTKAYTYNVYYNGVNLSSSSLVIDKSKLSSFDYFIVFSSSEGKIRFLSNDRKYAPSVSVLGLGGYSIPYTGGYTWDNVENKKENESVSLPIPGNLGQLVGQGSTDFWDNTDNLVGTGDITVPNVDNPSIGFDDVISFPTVGDVPDVDVPDVDVPGNDIVVPSFPNFGDSLDFSPMYLTNVAEKFPFSLPWDIGRLIQRFDVDPVAPVFDIPIFSETITLDLTEFDELAAIVKFFVLIGFILALIFISTKLLG